MVSESVQDIITESVEYGKNTTQRTGTRDNFGGKSIPNTAITTEIDPVAED